MAANSFGNIFRITTWGESHGKAIGVVIDGCPAGLEISDEEINAELNRRSPGKSPFTSPRKEPDQGEILSGVFEGKTTGAPLSFVIWNKDSDSSKYEPIKDLLRPGHANYTYLEKYGVFDYRGSGRASARETACRVAGGAVAKKILKYYGIDLVAYIKQIGPILAEIDYEDIKQLREATYLNPLYCPNPKASEEMRLKLEQAMAEGDSLGGMIELIVDPLPIGLGDPIYEKLEANLAKAMLSLPATKGFEIGSGFRAPAMKGSEHNDLFVKKGDGIATETNRAGGTLGGISTGMPLMARIAFKPTSSIKKTQETLNLESEKATLTLPEGSRQDPCVTIRAVPIVEAMAALVLVDALLLNRCARL